MSRASIARHSVLIALLALGACTTVSEPVRTGKNTYLLDTKKCDGIFFYGGSCSIAGIKAANNFCEKKGMVATVAETMPDALEHGRSVQFYCTDEDRQRDSVLRPDRGISTVQQR
jgi:hypothetical protein